MRLGWLQRSAPEPLWNLFHQARDTLNLLLERRIWLVLGVDFLMLSLSLFEVLVDGARPDAIYRRLVLLPVLLLAVPTMSSAITLERRAGSLDLALAVPSTERYFLRRFGLVLLLFIGQAWIILALTTGGLDLMRGLVQSLLSGLLAGAAVLFWAVRLRSGGAVMVASLLTLGLLGSWYFSSPFSPSELPIYVLGLARSTWDWLATQAILALAATVLYLYARQRLRRPEKLLY